MAKFVPLNQDFGHPVEPWKFPLPLPMPEYDYQTPYRGTFVGNVVEGEFRRIDPPSDVEP